MEKFIKFKENINIKKLSEDISDENVIILRESKLTGTIQVRFLKNISNNEIKKIFKPYTILKIHDEFPYSNQTSSWKLRDALHWLKF